MTDMRSAPSATASAPAYEPDQWNDTTTPEQRAAFLKNNHAAIVNIIGVADRNKIPADDTERFRHASQIQQNPHHRALQAVTAFVEADEKLKGDDQKLAGHFGLKADQISDLRQTMQMMEKAFGYQEYSNCYTYAMNDRDGLRSRHKNMGGDDVGGRGLNGVDIQRAKIQANNSQDYDAYKKAVMEGVIADGATKGGPDAEPKEGHYRVAVYTKRLPEGRTSSDPNFDMHYVRENRDGGWSHKLGVDPVTDKDKDGKPILDPKTANISGYEFQSFVYVPEGGLDVGERDEPASKPGSIQMEREKAKLGSTGHGAFPDLQNMAGQIQSAATAKLEASTTAPTSKENVYEPAKISIPVAFGV